jgi:uncharacterized protein (TIGR03435 family)
VHVSKTAAAFVFGLSVSMLVYAQSSRSQFEVASVKRNVNGADSDFEVNAGGRFGATNRTVSDLIFHANNLRPYQVPDKPDWIHSERYDIAARASRNQSWAETMSMLQSLMEDRFKLQAHLETKELPVFFLKPAREGIKLKPSTAKCVRFDPSVRSPTAGERENALPSCRAGALSGGEIKRWIAENASISDVTYLLSLLLGRKIIDKTGFSGRFDVDLKFISDPLKTDGTVPPLVTVLQDDLGLSVESGRGPVEVFVIDRIEHPSED